MLQSYQFGDEMQTIENFDLTTKNGRYLARKNGFDVPHLKRGAKQTDFWKRIDKKEDIFCWNWLGPVNKDGYGRAKFGNEYGYVHRLSLKYHFPDLNLQKKVVMHICDNPKCCNPRHLLVGTHADNQADKYKKNRQAKGEKNGMSFLTEEKVLEIREKYKKGDITYKQLAKEYGVCKDTMQKAIRGISWKHL
jgi:hypothetical protein